MRTTCPTAADRRRQVGVTAAGVLLLAAMLMTGGVVGRRGDLRDLVWTHGPTTPLTPAAPGFLAWTVLVCACATYVVLQWSSEEVTSSRHRSTAWHLAAVMVLVSAWVLLTWLRFLVLVPAVVLAVLVVAARAIDLLATTAEDDDGPEDPGLAATVGAVLGWGCVTAADVVAAALAERGRWPSPPLADALAVAAVALIVGAGVVVPRLAQGNGQARWGTALGVVWGLLWLVVACLTGEPRSTIVALVAALGAVLVLGATGAAGHRARVRRAPRGRA